MRRQKQFVTLLAVLFVFVSFLGSMPMALFYVVEGGGGGGGTSWPKISTSSLLIPRGTSGNWNTDVYVGWTVIETEDYIVGVRLAVSDLNIFTGEVRMHLATFYTFKGERTHNWQQNEGVLCAMKIEVKEFGSYLNERDAEWSTSDISTGCWPLYYTDFSSGPSPWSPWAKLLLGVLIDTAVALSGIGMVGEVLVGAFVDLLMESGTDPKQSAVNQITQYGDSDGHFSWTCFDTMSDYYYGGTYGPYEDGWQLAYDFTSETRITAQWTEVVPSGTYLGLKFRAVAIAETMLGYDTITTPWMYVGMYA